jgi:hypothetical protein
MRCTSCGRDVEIGIRIGIGIEAGERARMNSVFVPPCLVYAPRPKKEMYVLKTLGQGHSLDEWIQAW